MSAEVILGDCLEVMRGMEENSIDSVVTDPPYGLSFMGKHWDHGVPGVPFWAQALRIAKPGSRLLAFGGTRTYHRMACAIEDAGWQIEDSLCWLYGSGFPKHKSKLKPAHEPIVMARKPAPRATLLNIDDCRIGNGRRFNAPAGNDGTSPASFAPVNISGYEGNTVSGRWPANVLLDEIAASALDEMSGERKGWSSQNRISEPEVGYHGKMASPLGWSEGYNDTGGASRFFYTAKSSRSEREAGLEDRPQRLVNTLNEYKANSEGRTARKAGGAPRANVHPTVKPVALMRWLVRLVAPPDGVVLDPFTGSGTTGIAAALEGRRFVGIEREAEYVEIARARIAHAQPSLGVA
jgi:DNA modification methylase